MLDVRGLRKVYEGHGRAVEAVRDLTFGVGQGDLVCVVGPSGAGKTTLLKCIAGLLAPTSGQVVLEGKPVAGPPPGMAVVFQEFAAQMRNQGFRKPHQAMRDAAMVHNLPSEDEEGHCHQRE